MLCIVGWLSSHRSSPNLKWSTSIEYEIITTHARRLTPGFFLAFVYARCPHLKPIFVNATLETLQDHIHLWQKTKIAVSVFTPAVVIPIYTFCTPSRPTFSKQTRSRLPLRAICFRYYHACFAKKIDILLIAKTIVPNRMRTSNFNRKIADLRWNVACYFLSIVKNLLYIYKNRSCLIHLMMSHSANDVDSAHTQWKYLEVVRRK